jgi:hypothetical protein
MTQAHVDGAWLRRQYASISDRAGSPSIDLIDISTEQRLLREPPPGHALKEGREADRPQRLDRFAIACTDESSRLACEGGTIWQTCPTHAIVIRSKQRTYSRFREQLYCSFTMVRHRDASISRGDSVVRDFTANHCQPDISFEQLTGIGCADVKRINVHHCDVSPSSRRNHTGLFLQEC